MTDAVIQKIPCQQVEKEAVICTVELHFKVVQYKTYFIQHNNDQIIKC